jgi:hypothetical protein
MTTAMILDRRALRPAPFYLRSSFFVLLFSFFPTPSYHAFG